MEKFSRWPLDFGRAIVQAGIARRAGVVMSARDYLERLRRGLLRCNRWLSSRAGTCLLGCLVAAAYSYAYLNHIALPGRDANNPLGWWGWWDQGQYLKCAASLAHASLSQETYWYPLGYPALGALFYRVMPLHAFFVPDLLLVVGAALLFYRMATRFITGIEAVLLLAVFSFWYRETISNCLVSPWNTIPTMALTYALILSLGLGGPSRKTVLWGALGLGLMYLCRPPDAVCLGLILVVAVLRLPSWNQRVKVGAAAAIILFVIVGSILFINQSVFGSWRTRYEVLSAGIGFNSFPLAQKAFSLLVDGKPLFDLDDTALLLHFPWLILLPPGVVSLVRRHNWGAVGVLLSIAGTYGIYFAYNDFWPGNIFRYHLIHYLFWTFPILALLVYVGLREAWRDRIGRLGYAFAALLLVPVSILTLKENALGRVSLPLSAKLVIPPASASSLDWIRLTGAEPKAEPFDAVFGLTAFKDFITIGRKDGSLIFLTKRARQRPVTIEPTDTQEGKALVYGTLDWTLRWPPRPFSLRTPSRALDITLRRTEEGVDVTGPLGVPDGRTDQVIEVGLDEGLAQTIATWDIETTDHRGHWVSNKNPHGWWLIKVDPLPATSTQPNRLHLRLIFPDYGDFERAPAFVLRATDFDGRIVVEKTISK